MFAVELPYGEFLCHRFGAWARVPLQADLVAALTALNASASCLPRRSTSAMPLPYLRLPQHRHKASLQANIAETRFVFSMELATVREDEAA